MPVGTMLQSLFVTAIGRAIPILYQKILRRRKVDAAIRADGPQNSAIKQALMDYEVIVGSTYGTLTETLDKFLRELESSGVIVCMAEEAVVKRRTVATRAAFSIFTLKFLASYQETLMRSTSKLLFPLKRRLSC
jgi:hypothetical protein